jgi:membrane-associated phospholipid phosphatase
LIGLTLLQLVLWSRLPASHALFAVYAGAIVVLTVTACLARPHGRGWISSIDDLLLPIVILLVVFETIGYSIPVTSRAWVEPVALAFDRKLFGMVGSVYLEQFYDRTLLDALHLFYVIFYLVPLSLLVVMYTRRSRAEFQDALSAIALTFYLCFFLYYLFPVVGPYRNPAVLEQFTKDILSSGGELTRYVRKFVQHAEWTSYDCFPSVHAAVTLVTVFLSYRYNLSIRRYYLLPAAMILISTVYLRYHYVLDIVAGAFIAVAVYWIPNVLRRSTVRREESAKLERLH